MRLKQLNIGCMDRKSFVIAVAIFLFSALVGLIYNSVYPKGIPLIRHRVRVGDTLVIRPVKQPSDTLVASKVLGLEETFRAYESGEAVFLDARPRSEYEKGHITGAFSLPEFGFDEVYFSISELLSREMHLIVYCQGEDCDESMIVSQRLLEMGYKRVDIFLGGWPEWKNAGYPTEEGPPEQEEE